MSGYLVSSIEGRGFESETVRIGDLNGDGAPDLLFVQSVYGTREIRCLTAATIRGDLHRHKHVFGVSSHHRDEPVHPGGVPPLPLPSLGREAGVGGIRADRLLAADHRSAGARPAVATDSL